MINDRHAHAFVLYPAAPVPPASDGAHRAIRLLRVAGLAGLPQLNLPLAGRDGAPMGLSLLGPRGSDHALVAMAVRLAAAGVGK